MGLTSCEEGTNPRVGASNLRQGCFDERQGTVYIVSMKRVTAEDGAAHATASYVIEGEDDTTGRDAHRAEASFLFRRPRLLFIQETEP